MITEFFRFKLNIWYQPDRAAPHYSNRVIQFLKEKNIYGVSRSS